MLKKHIIIFQQTQLIYCYIIIFLDIFCLAQAILKPFRKLPIQVMACYAVGSKNVCIFCCYWFSQLGNSSDSSRKQIFRKIFIFNQEIVCFVYSLELPHHGSSNECTQHTIIV